MEPIASLARVEPSVVTPLVAIQIADDRSCVGPHFRGETVRIGFQSEMRIFARENLELVKRVFGKAGHEKFPYTARAAISKWMCAPVPKIEVADYAHALCVRRPNCEMYPTDSRDFF